MPAYHSALLPELAAKPVKVAHLGKSQAFTFDLRKAYDLQAGLPGLPREYKDCGVFYADLPGREEFAIFEQRAGFTKLGSYFGFLKAVSAVVLNLTKPVVLLTGRASLDALPASDSVHLTRLNGAPAVAIVYHTSLHDSSEATHILDELAIRFDCVGDFCCGYGRTAKTFHRAGKRFVVSDYNPACIGRMAAEWQSWK